MMPRILATLLAVLLPLNAAPEIVCALGKGATAYKPSNDQRPSPDAMQLAGRLNAAVKAICGQNCPTMALFRNANAPNVMLINDSGEAKIVYSPQFFSAAYDRYGDLGIVAILSHELGHALDASLGASWIKSSWTPELRADAWAGCILAKTDAAATGLEPALGALQSYSSAAHPAWAQRLPVVRAGYTACGGNAAKLDNGKAAGR